MPCRYDIPEPSLEDREVSRVCRLLVYVAGAKPTRTKLSDKILKSAALVGAENIYGLARQLSLNDLTADLCARVSAMDFKTQERVIYDGRSADARKLADWWEAHQKKDAARKRTEAKDVAHKALVSRALAKLTAEERAALGH